MALGNLIKTWENIMRDDDGVNGTVQVLSQLVWMLFLKVYDLKEDMWEIYEDDFVSAIPENCRWRNWAKGKSQKDQMTGDALVEFVNNTLFPTLKQLTVTAESSKRLSIVRDMMAESYNYMKDGVCIRKAVDLLDGIDFEDKEELHAFNVIYETLLKGLQSAGRSGEFYTPAQSPNSLRRKSIRSLEKSRQILLAAREDFWWMPWSICGNRSNVPKIMPLLNVPFSA